MADYKIEFKPQALRDLDTLSSKDAQRVVARIERMRSGLVGDIKRLSNFTPSFRLRVGNYRVLFEAVGRRIDIYRIKDRKDAYD